MPNYVTADWLGDCAISNNDDYPTSDAYVHHQCDNSTLAGLLWCEARHIINWASKPHIVTIDGKSKRIPPLTSIQAKILYWWLFGLTVIDIAQQFRVSRRTIRTHLQRALYKCSFYPHKGLETVMVEALGWQAVREYFRRQNN